MEYFGVFKNKEHGKGLYCSVEKTGFLKMYYFTFRKKNHTYKD